MIIFDFDGVIADSLDQHLGAYAEIFQLYKRELHISSPDAWRNEYDSAWENNFYKGGFSHGEMREAMSKYFDFVDYSKVELFPGIKELIVKFSTQLPMAICSSTDSAIIHEKLVAEGLRDCFALIVGSNETSSKLEKLKNIFAELSPNKDYTVSVGDTAADVRAGKEFGIHTIGVSYGWYAEERISAEHPTALARDVSELEEHLRALTSP